MQKRLGSLVWLLLLFPAWILLQAMHEAGHVIHASLSGGSGIAVELPLFGFSRTDVANNPNPLFIIWGGVLWGVAIPLLLLLAIPRRWGRTHQAIQAFAGLCLIGNGAYLAVGWMGRVGDAGDLMRYGIRPWLLIAIGSPVMVAGLWLWHRLGQHPLNKKRADVD